MNIQLKDIIGKTIIKIEQNDEDDELLFYMQDGSKYLMFHEQDCCEHVYLDDICGDMGDLLNSPIIKANDTSIDDESACVEWTFYNIGTIKGEVTLTWRGESEYYSTDVSFYETFDDRQLYKVKQTWE